MGCPPLSLGHWYVVLWTQIVALQAFEIYLWSISKAFVDMDQSL